MNRREQQADAERARGRAVELGESGDVEALDELLDLSRHGRPTVRRAAASALGKLAESGDVRTAIPRLCELARDTHPQVRQYAMLALGKTGEESALDVLRDAANRSSEKEYNLRAAIRAIKQIESVVQARREFGPTACSRCGRDASADERELSEAQFQRVYCGRCFDSVFIERRNFDMKVQNQKTILTEDRTVVQSKGERRIADWLSSRDIDYRYDDKFQIIMGYAVRPDFYLQPFDVYIEYWGLDTTDYKIGMLLKKKLYQQEGRKLISLYPGDLRCLDEKLVRALQALGYIPQPAERA